MTGELERMGMLQVHPCCRAVFASNHSLVSCIKLLFLNLYMNML